MLTAEAESAFNSLIFTLLREQSLPHRIQSLPYSEVEAEMYRALRPPTPETPSRPRPSAVLALAPLIDAVLPQQHDHARKQTNRLLFEYRWRYFLVTSESVGQLLKPFEHQPAPGLPNVAHGSR